MSFPNTTTQICILFLAFSPLISFWSCRRCYICCHRVFNVYYNSLICVPLYHLHKIPDHLLFLVENLGFEHISLNSYCNAYSAKNCNVYNTQKYKFLIENLDKSYMSNSCKMIEFQSIRETRFSLGFQHIHT